MRYQPRVTEIEEEQGTVVLGVSDWLFTVHPVPLALMLPVNPALRHTDVYSKMLRSTSFGTVHI